MRKSLAVLALSLASVFAAQSAKADDACHVASNLVTNCGFESGDFTGWTGSSTTDPFSGVDGSQPYSGNDAAFLGSFSDTTLSQTIATTAGTTYTISFVLDNEAPAQPPGYTNDFSATFGSTLGTSLSNADVFDYTVESFTAVASGASTVLTFTSSNQALVWDLDSISVTAVPTTSPVPEPGSVMLLGTGTLGLLGAARRRVKR